MTDVRLLRCPVEPGEAERLRAWYAELQDREDEVVETLRQEGVLTETAFLRESEETTYLYVYMESVDFEAADAAGDEEAFEIDAEHHAVLRDCLTGEWEPLETVGHYTNPERG